MIAVLRRHGPLAAVALLSLAATATSLGHQFTYDDVGIIVENSRVHSLRNLPALFGETYWPAKFGGDGYRPVVIALFALQWAAGGGAPWLFHLVNVLLALAASLSLYWCARALLPRTPAAVAGALFAVHPVHVEVTGNVVGQAELVVAVCLFLATGRYLRARLGAAGDGTLTARDTAIVSGLFAVALFAKEHAVVLPALLAAAELTVAPAGGWRSRARATRLPALAILATALLWFGMRSAVQRDFAGFIPFPVFRYLDMGWLDRAGTMMHEIPRVARLLVFPTHLSADYSPADVVVANGLDVAQLPGWFITLGTPLLAFALRRRAPLAAFALLWIVVSYLPVSNLLVPAGFVTAERTLFLASAGVALLAGGSADFVLRRGDRTLLLGGIAALVLFLALGVWRSVDRQQVWRSNDVFFPQLVRDAPQGYRAHFMYARHVGRKGRLREMEQGYKTAMRIFPYDAVMTLAIAESYAGAGLFAPAASIFEWTYEVEPAMPQGRSTYVAVLERLGRWREAREQAFIALPITPPRDVRYLRGVIARADSALGRRRPAAQTPVLESARTRAESGIPAP